MDQIVVIDTESTTSNKGHPFDYRNRLCMIGLRRDNEHFIWKVGADAPVGRIIQEVSKVLGSARLLVGFNLKHDLHWLRRYGCELPDCLFYDVQLAEYVLSCQQHAYPSLDRTSEKYGLGKKLDNIKLNYWDKKIDTPDIPEKELEEYLIQDLNLTWQCYEHQQKLLENEEGFKRIIKAMNYDLRVLEEMEFNGLIYDVDLYKKASDKCIADIMKIDNQLSNLIENSDKINWGSPQQVSAVLYGGTITYSEKELVHKTLKSGKVSSRLQNVEKTLSFPRIVTPLPKTELQNGTSWSVSEDVLKELRAVGVAKKIITLILSRHELVKLNSTYFAGIPKLGEEMGWPKGVIHGNLNQCVVVTGRLSSSRPNQQNMPNHLDEFLLSRYP